MTGRIRRFLAPLFGLTPAEEAEARAAAGKPWRTAYYVASRDWPPPPTDAPTPEETYAALRELGEWRDAE